MAERSTYRVGRLSDVGCDSYSVMSFTEWKGEKPKFVCVRNANVAPPVNNGTNPTRQRTINLHVEQLGSQYILK